MPGDLTGWHLTMSSGAKARRPVLAWPGARLSGFMLPVPELWVPHPCVFARVGSGVAPRFAVFEACVVPAPTLWDSRRAGVFSAVPTGLFLVFWCDPGLTPRDVICRRFAAG